MQGGQLLERACEQQGRRGALGECSQDLESPAAGDCDQAAPVACLVRPRGRDAEPASDTTTDTDQHRSDRQLGAF